MPARTNCKFEHQLAFDKLPVKQSIKSQQRLILCLSVKEQGEQQSCSASKKRLPKIKLWHQLWSMLWCDGCIIFNPSKN